MNRWVVFSQRGAVIGTIEAESYYAARALAFTMYGHAHVSLESCERAAVRTEARERDTAAKLDGCAAEIMFAVYREGVR